jgi:hypothetical protein
MKTLRQNRILIVAATALFIWPLFFQGVHVFTEHHDHLHCGTCCEEAPKEDPDENDDSCKICAFHFALFKQTENNLLRFICRSFPRKMVIIPEVNYFPSISIGYLLRAPPAIPRLSA